MQNSVIISLTSEKKVFKSDTGNDNFTFSFLCVYTIFSLKLFTDMIKLMETEAQSLMLFAYIFNSLHFAISRLACSYY